MKRHDVVGGLGWAGLALGTLLALGGTARLPGGIRLGIAPPLLIALVLLAVGFAAWKAPERGRIVLGLWLVPLVVLLLPRSVAAGALTGPPLLAVAAAALLLVAPEGWRPDRRLFVPIVFALYAVVSLRVQEQVGPQGDEPHYLMVAESLLRDGDLSLEQDYREARYAAFFHEGPLEPHFRKRGRQGEIYSLHAVGLSLLVLPAYALGGYAAASLFMAGLALLAALAIRALLVAATDVATGERTAWIVAFCPPLVHYAGLLFTEVPAALVAAWALREGMRARDITVARALGVGLALAFLPWLNVRYAILAVVLAVYWLTGRPPRRVLIALFAPAVLSAGALALYHHALYGFYDPRRVYGTQPEFALATLKEGLPGLVLDQEFGLFIYAPVFVLAIPGLIQLLRRDRRLGGAALAAVLAVGLTAGSWHMWRGGFNPPARFLVPIVPALAVGAAVWMAQRRWAGAALLVGWSLFTGLAGAADPALVHRDRDGTAPLFRARSGATEWTRLLPSYVLEEPDRHRLALLWALALTAAAIRGRGTRPGATFTAALLALAVVTEAAARISDARSGGREATRLWGRRAFDWPPGGTGAALSSAWGPNDLAGGPLYQPHRDSGRLAVAERLTLPAGPYRLTLSVQSLGGTLGPPPSLVWVGPRGRVVGRSACTGSGAWNCSFEVFSPAAEMTLGMEQGSPCRINEIELRAGGSTFPGEVGLIRQEGKVGGSGQ